MTMKTRFVVGMLVAALGACDGGGGGGGTPIAIDQLDEEAASVTCAKIFECCDAAERMEALGFITPVPTTEAECVTAYGSLIAAFYAELEAGVTDGTIVYHGDKAGNCLAAAENASCAEFNGGEINSDNADCETTFEGTVATGAACTTSEQCVSGACVGETGAQTCVTLPGVGQPCPDFQCADGAYCEYTKAGGECVTLKANGTACNSDYECADDFCEGADPQMGTPGTCAAEPATCDGA
jgi:hypothetical protein